jgi:hypothetical protein
MKVFPTAMAEFFLEGVPRMSFRECSLKRLARAIPAKNLSHRFGQQTLVYMFQVSLIDILTSLVRMQE